MLKVSTSYYQNDSFHCSTWNMLPTSESWQRCHMNMGENMRFYTYLLFWFTDIKPHIVFYKVQSGNGVQSSSCKRWQILYMQKAEKALNPGSYFSTKIISIWNYFLLLCYTE